MLDFKFPIKPEPKLRARMGKYGVYTPQKTVDVEAALQTLAICQLPKPFKLINGPVEVQAVFHVTHPKRLPQKRTYPTVRPDLDNYMKLLFDAMNGIVWADDAQIVKVNSHKAYAEKAAIYLTVIEIKEGESSVSDCVDVCSLCGGPVFRCSRVSGMEFSHDLEKINLGRRLPEEDSERYSIGS